MRVLLVERAMAARVRTAEQPTERFVCSGRRPAVAPATEAGDR